MQHIDEPLKRYEPRIFNKSNSPALKLRLVIDEVPDGKYVKYDDVKHFLELLAQKVRMF